MEGLGPARDLLIHHMAQITTGHFRQPAFRAGLDSGSKTFGTARSGNFNQLITFLADWPKGSSHCAGRPGPFPAGRWCAVASDFLSCWGPVSCPTVTRKAGLSELYAETRRAPELTVGLFNASQRSTAL